MKHTLSIIFLFLILFINVQSQTPQAIPYQAVARDNSGNLIVNQSVNVRFKIHDATISGGIVYSEMQLKTTNTLGLFTANIGQGTVVSGSFSSINWGSNSKFLQVEIDVAGGTNFIDMGTQQMLSVPYALQASSLSIPIIPGNNISSLSCNSTNISGPSGIDVEGNYAYVISRLNNRLCIYDISDPNNIVAKGFTNTNLANPFNVSVVGNYAYVTSLDNDRLCIFDISNPNSIIAKGFTSTNMDGPLDVFIQGNLAYVACNLNGRLCIFDISDPMNIVAKGFTATNLSIGVFGVFVSGNFAYVTSSNNGRLCIYDISNPNSIIPKSFISVLNAEPIFVSGNYAYVGGGSNINTLFIFDISDPNNIVAKGLTNNNLNVIQSIKVIGKNAFLTSEVNHRFVVLEISDPNNPVEKGFTTTNLNFPIALDISGNYAYINCFGTNSICSFTISDDQIIIQKSDGSLSSVSQSWEYGSNNILHNLNNGNIGIGTSTPIQKLEILGMNVAPAVSGSVANGIIRLQPAGSSGMLDMGMITSPTTYGWIQSRDNSSYALNYDLALNPNGGKVAIATSTPNSTLSLNGSLSLPTTIKTTSYSLTLADYCVIYTGGSGSTITLPAASSCSGRNYVLINHGINSITTSPAYRVSNSSTSSSVNIGTVVHVISDGTEWRKMN